MRLRASFSDTVARGGRSTFSSLTAFNLLNLRKHVSYA